MKQFKFIIPMLAFVMAIGMSFATVSNELDYYQDNGWKSVPEVTCQPADDECYIRLQADGPSLQLYDTPSIGDPKEGDGSVIDLF